jgi:translation initiation factor 4G
MSAPNSNAQNPPIAVSQNATAAPAPSSGSSANVAAGSAQPTARSYANATKKNSSPTIASSAAPPVAVGALQPAQHGRGSSVSPVNGRNPIQPALPTMGPAIVNSSGLASGHHSRTSSVTISAAGPSGYIPNGAPATRGAPNLQFGAMGGSPAPSHATPNQPQGANLNAQTPNPRVASPAHSPSPIPQFSGGKPNTLSGRPDISFGTGEGTEHSVRSTRQF